MADQIVVVMIALIASFLLVSGVISFAKGNSQVYEYRGPFSPRKAVVVTGGANDIVTIVTVIIGTISLLMAVGFWVGLVSFGWVVAVAAISIILHRLITLTVIGGQK